MSREEHFAEGEKKLSQSRDADTNYTAEYRTTLAAQAAAHFLAALAAPLAWPPVGREVLVEDGEIKP